MKAYVAPPCSRLDEPPMVAVVEEGRGFAELEGEWDGLHAASPAATPFQSWAWLYSWWEHYGQGRHRLRLVTVREGAGGPLVGVAPLMVEGRRGPGRLLFVGTGFLCYQDLLAREGWEGVVAGAAAGAVRRMGGWVVADLQDLHPGAVSWRLLDEYEGPYVKLPKAWESDYLVIKVKPWDQMLKALSRNHRSVARRALRRAQEDGVRCALAGPQEAEEAARRLVVLHREMWRDRGIEPEHLSERYESYMAAAARRVTARGLGAVSEFRRDGEVVISDFLVFGRDFLGTYMQGAGQEAIRRYSFNSLYIWDAANVARGRNLTSLSLMYGQEPYKLRWKPGVVPNHRVVVGRDPVLWRLYAGYHVLRFNLTSYRVRSGITPQWMKNAAKRYRALRSRGLRSVGLVAIPRWIGGMKMRLKRR